MHYGVFHMLGKRPHETIYILPWYFYEGMVDLETNEIIFFWGSSTYIWLEKRASGSNNFHAFSSSHGLLEIKSNDNKSRALIES